jgi:hypothetical protein
MDTVLDKGARYIITPMILGEGHLIENYLSPSHPNNLSDRFVLGRDTPDKALKEF